MQNPASLLQLNSEIMSREIEIHIEKLVMHGIPTNNSYRIAEAIQSEITRQLTENGIPNNLQSAGHIALMNAGTVNIASQNAAVVGRKVAQKIYNSFIYENNCSKK